MKFPTVLLFSMFFCILSTSLKAQEKVAQKPTVQDLDFLIGTWDITFTFYDPRNPARGETFTEMGVKTCQYDMELNGVPMFIVCETELIGKAQQEKLNGRKRKATEFIRYGPFVNTFERVELYSNWPATAIEQLDYDSLTNKFVIKGQLAVQDNKLERYEDIFQFNNDYTYYDRKNVANFSDMPTTEFNLVLIGTGKKRK